MRKADAVRHYGSEAAVAVAAGVSRQAVNKWGPIVPYHSAVILSREAPGKLQLQDSDYRSGGIPIEPRPV